MQIKISTRHGQLSEATREKMHGKVQRLLKVFERLTQIEVTVDLERADEPEIEIRADAEHKHDFVAKDRAGEMWVTLDSVLHKLEQQLRKYKERVQDHRKPGLRQAAGERAGEPEAEE